MRRISTGRLALRTIAVVWLLVIVALPLAAVIATAAQGGAGAVWAAISGRTARAALWLTLWTALVVTVINVVMGTLTAWLLVRGRLPGRALVDALVDLPVALPTLVTGLMIVVLFGPHEPLGAYLAGHGVRVLFASPGILLAMLICTFPYVVRAVQPVIHELDAAEEEAAWTLGAGPFSTFRRVVLPALAPAILTGALSTFARALGEFGSVVVVAGNIPGRTLTAPVHIFGAIESGEPQAASAMSALLVAVSFTLVLISERVGQRRRQARA